ncbi:50S ribosomal protein L6 [Betaproteobacteria bacterium]|nr:50S ribosomal protein L6 [Betaproteobacteria bacterium]GHU15950.1 50S ribosomal protein L6 [Betaproteobacteria bacterium]GHU25284.1 50S ribosomal protein L6 [Betaproteobacteria bacterium]GHU29759.1 50S ribosomal protein L6 [Betaproteobacteria bacterium]
MSRVAKNPVAIPGGVEVRISGAELSVKGPLGTVQHAVPAAVTVEREGDTLVVKGKEGVDNANALSGTTRALLANIVTGVTKGFEKKLTLIGVGYKAQAQDGKLNLTLGFSHPIVYQLPAGVKAETPTQTEIVIKGIDKQQVGQVASEVRAYRAPEPYKGKGVRYADETVVIKETKKK